MKTKPLLWVAVAAFVAFAAIFVWKQAETAGIHAQAETLIAEGDQFLKQAETQKSSAARDLRVKAARKAEEALKLVEGFPPALLLLGSAQLALGEAAKACAALDRLLEADPSNAQAQAEAGVAYFERWRLSKEFVHRVDAEKYFQQTLASDPASARALLYLGWLFHEAGEIEKRDPVWEKLEKLAPDSPEWRRAAAIRGR